MTLLRRPPLMRPTFTVTPEAEVGALGQSGNLPREFMNRARAAGRIDTGVRGHASGANPEVADALARGLQRAAWQ